MYTEESEETPQPKMSDHQIKLLLDPDFYLKATLDYITQVSDDKSDVHRFLDSLAQEMPEKEAVIMTYAEQLRQEGTEKTLAPAEISMPAAVDVDGTGYANGSQTNSNPLASKEIFERILAEAAAKITPKDLAENMLQRGFDEATICKVTKRYAEAVEKVIK